MVLAYEIKWNMLFVYPGTSFWWKYCLRKGFSIPCHEIMWICMKFCPWPQFIHFFIWFNYIFFFRTHNFDTKHTSSRFMLELIYCLLLLLIICFFFRLVTNFCWTIIADEREFYIKTVWKISNSYISNSILIDFYYFGKNFSVYHTMPNNLWIIFM